MNESQEFKKEIILGAESSAPSELAKEKNPETKIEQDILAGLHEDEMAIENNEIIDVVLHTALPQFIVKGLQENKNIGTMSKRELQDLRMWPSSGGADKYWMKRLQSEINILPSEISSMIRKSVGSKKIKPDEYDKFHEYIKNRLKILYFDVIKRNRMEILKNQLKTIDAGGELYKEEEDKERKKILFDEKRNSFYAEHKGEKVYLGLGDVAADYAWGLKYAADSSVPPHIRRAIAKRIVVNETRRDLEKMFDQELTKAHHVLLGVGSQKFDLETPDQWEGPVIGFFAERIVSELLTRLTLNHSQLGFAVERSSAIEDAELKYDLKIRRKQKLRGIALEGYDMPREEYVEEKKKRFGIQFTTDTRTETKKHKLSQIEEAKTKIGMIRKGLIKKDVDDIVLVAINLSGILEYVTRWFKDGKPPGGPERYMDHEMKKRILMETTKNFVPLSEEEIEKAVS